MTTSTQEQIHTTEYCSFSGECLVIEVAQEWLALALANNKLMWTYSSAATMDVWVLPRMALNASGPQASMFSTAKWYPTQHTWVLSVLCCITDAAVMSKAAVFWNQIVPIHSQLLGGVLCLVDTPPTVVSQRVKPLVFQSREGLTPNHHSGQGAVQIHADARGNDTDSCSLAWSARERLLRRELNCLHVKQWECGHQAPYQQGIWKLNTRCWSNYEKTITITESDTSKCTEIKTHTLLIDNSTYFFAVLDMKSCFAGVRWSKYCKLAQKLKIHTITLKSTYFFAMLDDICWC